MPPVAEEVARVRSLAARTAAAQEWPAEQLEAAEHISDRLGRYASAIVASDGSVPDCGMPRCPLDRHSSRSSAARLAVLLAQAQNLSATHPTTNGHGPNGHHASPNGHAAAGEADPAIAEEPSGPVADVLEPQDLDPNHLMKLHRRYVNALVDAAAVVYCCRRVLHTNGQCFFDAAGPGSGLCGRVLAVSHQLELNPLAS